MQAYVNLNDVFDDSVLKKRMDFALLADKNKFWENLFQCDNVHNDKITVVYLFTDYQLCLLWNFCDNNFGKKEDLAKTKLLDFKKQTTFNSIKVDDLINEKNKEKLNNKKVCIVMEIDKNKDKYEIKRLVFAKRTEETEKKGHLYFDSDTFTGNRPEVVTEEDRNEIMRRILLCRKDIVNTFRRTIIPDKNKGIINKWLHYYGDKNTGIETISYCKEDDNCTIKNL
jgi:hypothetical protein